MSQTDRRNLAYRIERFLTRIRTEGSQPDVDAIANLTLAIDCLERDDCPTGQDAMMLAEKGWAPRFAVTIEPKPLAELVAQFERLVARG